MNKIAAGIASIAMIANLALPLTVSAASTELTITGNGSDSNNTTTVTQQNNTVVSQTNNANITNNVNANSSSGGNTASKNTGGGVTVDTGSSTTVVGVENTANSNTANVTNCNCAADATVTISGNGSDSKNKADLSLNDSTVVAQSNAGSIINKVNANSKTGYNEANKNTGGDVEVSTGDALTHVDLTTNANANWANVGGNGGHGGDVSLWITGNGADSKNNIGLTLDHDVLLQQYNNSYVKNDVDANSSTGKNDANKNTGGSVSIDTGDASTGVAVDNATNFNWANIDCDCLTDVTAKVAGNGVDSVNKIKAVLSDNNNVFQDNSCGQSELLFWGWDGWGHKCGVNNNVDADSATGKNDAYDNTGDPGSDPEIMTGDSETLVGVSNEGNSNTFGAPFEGWDDSNVNFTFNLNALLAFLGMH